MEPVGPWSSYPYNRLAGVQAPTTTGELHHLPPATTSGVSTTTAQILPTGFLSPPPVGYEVFSPLFHPTGAKPPAHYVNQHRPALVQPQTGAKQPSEGEYHQQFFDQGWGQNSPFGILPHENVVAKGYENFNAPQFPQNQVKRGRSPVTVKTPPSQFFQPPSTFPENKIPNIQQTCIVTSPTNSVSKDYRVPQVRGPRPVEKNFPQKQVQTKAQSKVYPEIAERQRNDENPPSGFDNRNYSINGNKRNYPQNYQGRVYQGNEEFHRGANGPDPSVAIPRKPSPLHSQASPIGHPHSPAYPMYNSPMNSISSPQGSNQVTPPLDASVSRVNPQQSNVAYSSVITRNNEKFPNNQNCWDERRKFPQQSNYPNMNQQYYDSSNNQVTMTELSSCRGDPMSIIKNLAQNCAPEVKQEDNKKRRKSGEKPDPAMEPYYHSPIPPPAHSAAVNQQQQNGTYFEFDRWNQPKIFGAQPAMHQQQLMVPHPHGPPPPLPYFPSFHIPHHPSEYPSSVELTPISNYSEQSPQQGAPFQQPEEQSKVIVPNIEEELNFLSEVDSRIPTTSRGPSAPVTKPRGPAEPKKDAGFMNSYLKFLQGEKDSSPPPPSRGNRKSSWSRAKTAAAPPDPKVVANPQSNGNAPPQPIKTATPTTPKSSRLSLPQGDPQDDPRYFPLPKERKKNSFNDSDEGDSDDGFFRKKQPPVVKQEAPREKATDKSRLKKGRPPKQGGAGERKKDTVKAEKVKKAPVERKKAIKAEPEPVLRRESSKRAAKDKVSIHQLMIARDEELDDPYADSDSDPAWTPVAKDDDEDEMPVKKSKRGRKKAVRNLLSSGAEGIGISDEFSNDSHRKRRKEHRLPKPHDSNNQSGRESPAAEEGFFKAGEFVVIQAELGEDWPAIWRVDGKTLLQKYEPFEQNGKTLYRNISTYTSWTPDSKKQYIAVPVRYRSQSQLETIVEFLRAEMTFVDTEFLDRLLKQNETYQDNFEVYIQTLISQALDSNFLTEIFQERDEYFLSNVQTIDDITKSKCEKLLGLLKWPRVVQNSISTWPCFNLLREAGIADSASKPCAGCTYPGISMRVLLYGQPYNSTTLEGCQPDPQVPCEKDFLMCRICGNRVQLLNKIVHQKYLMYIECAKRVAEKRTSDPQKDTTCILNELLADETWLNQLFLEVRSSWCEVDGLEHNHKARNCTAQ